jgi:hypothetical protein
MGGAGLIINMDLSEKTHSGCSDRSAASPMSGEENRLACRLLCLRSERKKVLTSASFYVGDMAAPGTSNQRRIVGRGGQLSDARDR